MNNVIERKAVLTKLLMAAAAVVGAVALPQIFHLIGVVSGTGASVGAALLPMHIPVLLAGFLGGPVVGAVAGVLSPILSFLLTGMPLASIVPLMAIELGVYGLTAGLLRKAEMNSFIKLLIVQLAGRFARAAATLAAVYILGSVQLTVASAWEFVTAGLYGMLIQWALIPYLTEKLSGAKKLHE